MHGGKLRELMSLKNIVLHCNENGSHPSSIYIVVSNLSRLNGHRRRKSHVTINQSEDLTATHSKKKSTSEHLFWCFRLSQIEDSIQYLEGP